MTNGNIELSRRKILAGLGAVGAAGAGAGLGTSAFFSDEETFEGNTITAGTLDLKVDWEEHYSYPQLYGFDDPVGDDMDVTRSEPSDAADYQPLPDPNNPAVWVHQDDLDAYMDNTAIEAYPDVDEGDGGDGVQNDFNTGDVDDACTDGADTAEDLDPTGGLRTHNDDTYVDGQATPLVNLQDVKPGDFGELTLSMHLCDNPGYVWLAGELQEASENGHTDPESAADAEAGAADEAVTELDQADDIELLDEIEATVWYDGDCDNVLSGSDGGSEDGEAADVAVVLDVSGSMGGDKITNAKSGAKSLVDALGPNDQVSLVTFASSASLEAGLTTNHASVKTAIDDLSSGGGTDMVEGVEQGHEELLEGDQFPAYGESGNARSDARKIMIVLGDGQANIDDEADNAKDDDIELFTIAYGSGADTATLESMASSPAEDHFFEADVSEIEQLFQNIGGTVGSAGEEVITDGSLREVLTELESGEGIPLDGDLGTDERACYPALQTSCVGLAWHLPADVGNEVQSDGVSFDVGFYAEQCRNNDGTA